MVSVSKIVATRYAQECNARLTLFINVELSADKVFVSTRINLLRTFLHKQVVCSIPRLSASTGQNKCFGNSLLYETSVISIMVGHFDYKHKYLVEKNVPKVLIFPNRWQDGAESPGMETMSMVLGKARPLNR